MLANGVWTNPWSSSDNSDDRVRHETILERSKNQQEYLLFLEVLIEMRANSDDLVAALSLGWNSHFHRLVLPKRVWMGIYLGEKPVAYYSHLPGHKPTYSILEFYEKPVFDKDVWRKRIAEDIRSGVNAKAA